MRSYKDRRDAGMVLAQALQHYAKDNTAIVLALPRGGVPVAYEVAKALRLPLDIFIARKLGFPGHEEFAMGAIASGNTLFLNRALIEQARIPEDIINSVIEKEKQELARREKTYRNNRPFPDLTGKTVLLIDDGIATGFSLRAAIAGLKMLQPKRVVIAVPVAAADTLAELRGLVDEIVCPLQPANLQAVGLWYQNFSQTSDEEVMELLSNLHAR